MSTRDHGVLYRSRIDDDGDEISHMCILGVWSPTILAWSQRLLRQDTKVDLRTVKHIVEPLGPVGELDGLGMTFKHLLVLL